MRIIAIAILVISLLCVARASDAHAPGRQLTKDEIPAVVPTLAAASLDKQPKAVRMVNPEYPAELREKGIGGLVRARFVVATDGGVSKVEIVSSPHPALASATEAAIRRWKFQPGEKAGRKVNCLLEVPLTFEPPQE